MRTNFKLPRKPIDKADLILAAGTTSLVLVCLFLLGVPAFRHLEHRAHEATVRGNAATLQLAAETYAAAHLGNYPLDPWDLVPYLPNDQAPRNPYTGKASTFTGGVGDLTYRSPTRGQDYVIEAWGQGEKQRPRRLVLLQGHRPRL
ncbi:hypothetical protein CSA17_05165 [bacterium DOLJORAL78_65_58]|nr:MAG: hypothetical protein CSA17_05165 [bacterium DOLJORAL78_65_58]